MAVMATYNLLDYGQRDTAEEHARYERVHEVIRRMHDAAEGDAFVLAVQELIAAGEDKATVAAKRLAELAEATGLDYRDATGTPAVAVGNHRFHVGLLWSSGVTPVGAVKVFSGAEVWHSLVRLSLDVGARMPLRFASVHATPFGRYRRADEAERVLAIMTRTDGRAPGLIGGDWNAVGSDLVPRGGFVSEEDGEDPRWELYDPDPYAREVWHPDFVYQTRWEHRPDGTMRWWADREPGEVLWAGGAGLLDTAAALRAPWAPTTGHWDRSVDPFPPRRIDTIRVTTELEPALQSCTVVRDELSLTASDHLPFVLRFDERAITDNGHS